MKKFHNSYGNIFYLVPKEAKIDINLHSFALMENWQIPRIIA